jgi:hypothetical protein
VITGHFIGAHVRECDLELQGTEITYCDASGTGALAAGIQAEQSDLDLNGCLFEENRGPATIRSDGLWNASSWIENCHFISSHGRVALIQGQYTEIRHNWFENNGSGTGGTCLAISDCRGEVNYNTIVNNVGNGPFGSAVVSIHTDYRVDVRGNTLSGNEYWSGAGTTGFSLDIDHGFYFDANIIEGCIGPGVAVMIWGDHPWNRCNVFWDNEGEHYGNYIPHATDQIADPMFCNPEALDFTVHSDSPCAEGNTPDCGQIGAWGVGCGGTAVPPNSEPMSWGRVKERYRGRP